MKQKLSIEQVEGCILNIVVFVLIFLLIGAIWININYRMVIHCNVSMEPTFHDGDVGIHKKGNTNIKRYDIVSIGNKNGRIDKISVEKESIEKRVIGVPGDKIDVVEGHVYVNGVLDLYDTGDDNLSKKYSSNFSLTLGEDEYFVCGDNRGNSFDNRRVNFGGPVKLEEIESVWAFDFFK